MSFDGRDTWYVTSASIATAPFWVVFTTPENATVGVHAVGFRCIATSPAGARVVEILS